MTEPASAEELGPSCVAARYDVLDVLGQGGMATAYRVRDRTTGVELALKRLTVAGREGTVVELFEREFHTLTQLAHPRVVRAYDYGFDEDHAYYTMELLDGGDLRELAPLPWQEVCAIAYDVCSALSLLHSRRLVHRDLTPRNVRRTADGAAKLIDFGLLASFGPNNVVAGTPPYVAPEVVNMVSLDARSDLFSLGATLYFALTGRVAFRVTRFEQLRDVWRGKPVSPRKLVPEVPEAIDQLVMSLLRIDVGSRPRSAAEVLDRVAPLLAEPPDESLSIAGAYLIAPQQVGRDDMVMRMRKQIIRSVRGRGGGFAVTGDPGTGRSRALDAFVLEAKLMGAAVARAGASDAASGSFGALRALVTQIHQAAGATSLAVAGADPRIQALLFGETRAQPPVLLDIARPGSERGHVQEVLRDWLLGIANKRLVALAVDDLDLVDEPSAALLATLSLDAAQHRLAYAVSVRRDALDAPGPALAVLREHAHPVELSPLSEPQVRELLAGVFGDVPYLDGLSRQLHELSCGLPRECMTLAQHLVDAGVITYRAGSFRLPPSIDPSLLPADFESAHQAQLAGLPPHALHVGRLLSLSVIERLTRAQLVRVEGLSPEWVDAGIDALRRLQAVTGGPQGYRMCHPTVARLLLAGVDPEELGRLHDQLAAAYREAGAAEAAIAHHALLGSAPGAALDDLLAVCQSAEDRAALTYRGYETMGVDATSATFACAVETARALGRPKRELLLLYPVVAGTAAAGADARAYDLVASDWLSELKQASGYLDWLELTEEADPAGRAMQAVIRASQRYDATPEDERVAKPVDAIKELVAYVVFSIAVGARTKRHRLTDSLPALLEPFSPLNPVVNAMRLNAESSVAMRNGRREEGRDRCIELVAAIDALEGEQLAFMDKVRAALCQAIATQEAALGIAKEDPDEWLRSDDPNQRVGAEYIKKVAALHRGDWEAAEAHRRRAEVIALQNDATAMFSTLVEEFETHALARDLTGLRNVRARIHDMCKRVPNWRCIAVMADAYYDYLCGDPDAAMATITEARSGQLLPDGSRDPHGPFVEVLAVDILLERDEVEEAFAVGSRALSVCESLGLRHMGRVLSAPLALAEARLGRHAEATARLTRVIEAQTELGIAGLLLGRSHEYLARCALVRGDRAAFVSAARAAAEHYRPGHSEVLGALHERLMDDARHAGLIEGAGGLAYAHAEQAVELLTHISTTMMACREPGERASAALTLLREAAGSADAHLFLLSEAGLHLAASAGEEPAEVGDMLAFVQAQIELELDDDVCTMTAGLSESEVAALPTELCAGGRTYLPYSLIAEREGEFWLVGVALLAERESDHPLGTVTAVVAKHLIDSGDYAPIAAA